LASNWSPTEREADDFYRLYKAGADADTLRRDIAVSQQTIEYWQALRDVEHDRTAAHALSVMLPYREEILERFNCLVEGREYVKKPKARRFTVAPMQLHNVPRRMPETREELAEAHPVDGCGRPVKIETVAKILGIESQPGEFPSEFKRRVERAHKVFLGEMDSPPRSGGRGTPLAKEKGETEGQTLA